MKFSSRLSNPKKFTFLLTAIDIFLIFGQILGFRVTNIFLQAVLTSFVLLSIPVIVLLVFVKSKSGVLKSILILCLSTIFVVISVFRILDISGVYTIGYSKAFEQIQRVEVDERNQVAIYRTNGGATTDFGVQVFQEQNVIPGIKLVNLLTSYYHVNELKVEYIGDDKVKIIQVIPTNHKYTSDDIKWYGPLPVIGDILNLE